MNKYQECVSVTDDDGVTHVLPTRFIVCPRCNGFGQHDHPAFSNGMTDEEFERWDDEDYEEYFSGTHDVTCTGCRGKRVITEVDEDHCTPEQLSAYHSQLDSERAHAAETKAELLAGC